MAKVIVERPRIGSRMPTKEKGYDRRYARMDWENLPKRERMKARSGGHKSLNEHLGPLRRYLMSQLGKRWDTIFADVCRYLNRNSAVQDHVRDHLTDYVAIHVDVRDGSLFHADGWRVGVPLHSLFYVCPRTAILKKNPQYRRGSRRANPITVRFLEDRTALVRRGGEWLKIEWASMPKPVLTNGSYIWPRRFDALLDMEITRETAERVYGRTIHAVTVHRVSKRELRRYCNDYPHTNLIR